MLALIAALLLSPPAVEVKVSIVQGSLEAKATPDAPFAAVQAGAALPLGSSIRTGPGTKALLELADAFELRVNEQTELTIEAARKMMLHHGRVYLRIPKASAPFEIATELHPVTAEECVLDMEFKPRVPNGAPASTIYQVLEGKAKPHSRKFSPEITKGWWATGFGTQLNTVDPIQNMALATAWVHSLLVERGKEDEETGMRTEELLQILSKQEPNDPAEAAIRGLKELAAPGLARFLSRSFLETQVARRAAAARALADAATIKSAPLMAPLLTHAEAQVRLIIARGLARIAGGKDLGFPDAYWKGDKLEEGQKAWEEWVKQNAK